MMSSMFEIPILYVACDVKIVKKEGVIFLLTCTSKNTVTKETSMFWRAFFSERGGERRILVEQNRSYRYFYLKI